MSEPYGVDWLLASGGGGEHGHAAALTVRARTCADQAASGSPDQLARGRDAADAAHRIATRRGLAWQELDALDAHAHLD